MPKYTEQSNWMIAGLISVMRAFYSSWEGIPEGFTRGQENISLRKVLHWTPLVLSEFQRDERNMDKWRKVLECHRKWFWILILRNQFQDEYWSICSWDFNRVSISTLWPSEISIHSIKQSLLTDLYYQVQGTGTHRDEPLYHCPLGVFDANWWLTV